MEAKQPTLAELAEARKAADQRQPKYSRSKALTYSQDGATSKADSVVAQRAVARWYEDYELKEASVPYCPYVRMIDPAGNVCSLMVSNHRLARSGEAYASHIMEKKQRAGWLPFDHVPTGAHRERQGVKATTDAEWEFEREEVIRVRQARQTAKNRIKGEAFQPFQERIIEELAKGSATASTAAIKAAIEALGDSRKGGK